MPDRSWLQRRALRAWMLVLLGSLAVACGPAQARTAVKNEPARLESIEGSELKRVILTAKAAERIALTTTTVREQSVTRTRTVGGEIVAGTTTSRTSVRVRLSPSEVARVDRSATAHLLPGLGATAGTPGTTARFVASQPAVDGATLQYELDGTGHGAVLGDRVMLRLPLIDGEAVRKLISYAAVLYDLDGTTWAYVQEAPLTFVRRRITVEYVEGDTAFLSDGPSAGAQVVTAGATELLGTESKLGK